MKAKKGFDNNNSATIESRTEVLTKRLNELTDLCKKHEQDFHKRTLTSEEREELEDQIEEALKKLNEVKIDILYLRMRDAKNPLLEAVKRGDAEVYRLKKNGKEKNSNKFYYSVGTKTDRIELYDFARWLGGENEKWIDTANAAWWYFYAVKSDRLMIESATCSLQGTGKKIYESFLEKEMNFLMNPENAKNPRGIGAQKEVLDSVVQACIGGKYHAKKCDVQMINDLFATDGKTILQIKEIDPKKFDKILMKMLHRIVKGGMYESAFLNKEVAKAARALAKEEEREKKEQEKAKEKANAKSGK